MVEAIDTLKVSTAGFGGFWISTWSILPDLVSLAVGFTTLAYLIIKIRKELK